MSFNQLNEKQIEAIKHKDGPMMVLAGPGSGKTMVITHRVKYLINNYNINPKEILVITFTKATAEEMKIRFEDLTKGESFSKQVSFGTFHSFFFRILRMHYKYSIGNVLKEEHKYNLLKQIANHLEIQYEDEQEFINELQNEISLMKNELIGMEYYNSMVCSTEKYKEVVNLYENYKSKNKLIDFDDMLCKCYELLVNDENILKYWQSKYKYILIDEFQDINRVQYETTKLIAGKYNNLFVVGDDDQSIYKFRGARPEFLLDFPKDYENTSTVILDINYRSTKNIVDASKRVISNNENRYEKEIVTLKEDGKKPIKIECKDSEEEAKVIAERFIKLNKSGTPFKEMAVIYRTNIQSRAIVDIFMDMNIPFTVRDQVQSVYNHWVAKDIIAYLKLVLDKSENESFERIINKPKRYINKYIVTEAKKRGKLLIDEIYHIEDLKRWQIDRLEELRFQLQHIKGKPTYKAIKYIRKTIGYDNYLIEYAEYRNIGIKGLKEILDEIQESCKNYEEVEQWLAHIDEVNQEVAEQKKTKIYNNKDEDKIVLTTLHGAKGLEFENVWITGVVEGVIPHEKSVKPSDVEEERRLFYVGMTRAKKSLFLSTVETKYEEEVNKSRFLEEMERNFTIKDIEVGKKIVHNVYGKGIVQSLDNTYVTVQFNKNVQKKLDIRHCINKKIILDVGEV